ncbi:hypothetical protein TIFTF001_041919 [Ficus carica]|uniref:Uncharacterized protein n=1 Tax=Ficus carica TaxID=3494 RepID=A0AA88CWW9_FICCA|nr:hypothetical protein TIFTF001_041919 [Ficus carica]
MTFLHLPPLRSLQPRESPEESIPLKEKPAMKEDVAKEDHMDEPNESWLSILFSCTLPFIETIFILPV